MKILVINQSASPQWNNIASILSGEVGTVTSESTTDGNTYYNAVFAIYKGEFARIPSSICTVTDVPDPV